MVEFAFAVAVAVEVVVVVVVVVVVDFAVDAGGGETLVGLALVALATRAAVRALLKTEALEVCRPLVELEVARWRLQSVVGEEGSGLSQQHRSPSP